MIVDFRSDTITKPSQAMRIAMFEAEMGDDVFQEDPSAVALQKYAATLFGKEDALFCFSGTQTNQIAINVHVKPGGEVICSEEAHIYLYEGGGIAKNSGASVRLLKGNRGRISAEEIKEAILPDNIHYPETQLICLEDTMNRGGGAIHNFQEIKKISALAKEYQLPLHLDGARMMNALVENKVDFKEYAAQFDTISLCLSKGLGAPIGSLLIGSSEFIHKARRVRKVLGGGGRQIGMLAAAGLFALKNNVERLKIDNENAKRLEAMLLKLDWVKEVIPVETNIVVIETKMPDLRDVYIEKLSEKGIQTVAFGTGKIRMVTHLDISEVQLEYALEKLKLI